MPRYFTLDEARAALPAMRALLMELQAKKSRLDELGADTASRSRTIRGNGHQPRETGVMNPEQRNLIAEIEEGLRRIAGSGCEVKDIDAGLLDWPSVRDGRVVYLCWRMGEPDILYWHEIADGFAGRQRL